MTPLGASLIFVMVSLIFSSLQTLIFEPSSPSTHSNIQMSPVFRLSTLFVQKQPTHFKSLYQSYYGPRTQKAQSYTSKLKDRSQFNQSVLSQSLRNKQQSFLCESSFMVLVNTAIRGSGSQAGWQNTVRIYELPHMRQKDQILIFGHLQLPNKCKRRKSDAFELGLVNENRPMLLTISMQGKTMLYSNILAYLDEYSKEILEFDSAGNYWAYTSKEQPWVIHISEQPFTKNSVYNSLMIRNGKPHYSGVYNTNNFLQIDILDIETYQSGIYEGNHRLNIRHIFIENPANLYVTCVYEYYNTHNRIRSIIQQSFLIKHDQMRLLSRHILDTEQITGAQITTDCVIHKQLNMSQTSKLEYKLGCVLFKEGQEHVKYAYVNNVYVTKQERKKKTSPQTQDDDGYWFEDHFKDLYDGDSGEDLIWMMKRMTPLAKVEQFQKFEEPVQSKLQIFMFSSLSQLNIFPPQIHILKPSLPSPIIHYSFKTEDFIFSSYLQNNLLFQENVGKQSLEERYFRVEKPESLRLDERKLRSIRWLDDENLLLVCWGAGIELYRLQRMMQVETDWSTGFPMGSLLPFIELFATIFCMLQVVWRSPN